MTRGQCLTLALALLAVVFTPADAAAQYCSVPQPQNWECDGGGGCHESYTAHYCSWYGATSQTCGGFCALDLTCCGTVVDKVTVDCGSLCAGCEPKAARHAKNAAPKMAPKKASTPRPATSDRKGAELSAPVAKSAVAGSKR